MLAVFLTTVDSAGENWIAVWLSITFAQAPLYQTYAGLNEQPIWGFNTLEDQELGGLIMWVPGGMFFLIPLIGLLVRLISEEESSVAQKR